MRFANDYDIDTYLATFIDSTRGLSDQELPNLARAAINLARLRDWTNTVSDGWPYWSKPCRSAAKLIELLESKRYSHDDDITTAELRKALTPIKAMLTRVSKSGVDIRHGGGPVLLP